jgi:hypothetical protein
MANSITVRDVGLTSASCQVAARECSPQNRIAPILRMAFVCGMEVASRQMAVGSANERLRANDSCLKRGRGLSNLQEMAKAPRSRPTGSACQAQSRV